MQCSQIGVTRFKNLSLAKNNALDYMIIIMFKHGGIKSYRPEFSREYRKQDGKKNQIKRT
jgi:hypothetical protein